MMAAPGQTWKMMSVPRTLVFLIDFKSEKILLGLKKTGFGAGKILGIGGKAEHDESISAAALREVQEEIGVVVNAADLKNQGVIQFKFPAKPSWDQDVHVFTTTVWQGTPTESAEIRPSWYAFSEIPYPAMWDDAKYWLPKILKGEVIEPLIIFNDDLETVKHCQF